MSKGLSKAIRSLFNKQKSEEDLDLELSFHLENEIEVNIRLGMTRSEARRAALLSLGGLDRTKEEVRDQTRARAFEVVFQDLLYAIRVLFRRPGFSVAVVLTLALGLGANVAIFGVVNALLLHPEPFPGLDQLVLVRETGLRAGWEGNPMAAADLLDLDRERGPFDQISVFKFRTFNLTGAGDPDQLEGYKVSPGFFDLLGVKPEYGHAFYPDQDIDGRDRSIILSHALWKERFGGDPQILGRTLSLDGNTVTVVGIMSESFIYPAGAQLWTPLALSPAEKTDRASQSVFAIARLRAGVTFQQAAAQMKEFAGRLQKSYPDTNRERSISLIRLREEQYKYTAPLFLTLQGAALFVLLLALANAANLLLARVIGREKEIAIRRALGSSQWRLTSLFAAEAFLLCAAAGGVSALLGTLGVSLIRAGVPSGITIWISGWNQISVDGNVLLFTGLLTVLVGVVFAAAAAYRASKVNLNGALKEGGTGVAAGAARNRLRGTLVIAEVALSVVLLAGAGLMIRGFLDLINSFQGFQPQNVLTFSVTLPSYRYKDNVAVNDFLDRARNGIASLEGVQSVGIVNNPPASNVDNARTYFAIEGRAPLAGQLSSTDTESISEGFLSALKIPLIEGRDLLEIDGKDAQPVAVVSQEFVRQYFPSESAVGKRFRLVRTAGESPWLTVVGVCGSIKQNWWDAVPRPTVYLPFRQAPARSMSFLISTVQDPMVLAPGVRSVFQRIDPDQPLREVRSLQESIADSVAPVRIIGILMTVFGVLALFLSALGVYSVMAYVVAERSHEFGVRMALGARPADVLRLVNAQALRLSGAGIVLALPIAFVLGRILSGLIFGVAELNAATFLLLAVFIPLVALIAGYVPARRAAKKNPCTALRAG